MRVLDRLEAMPARLTPTQQQAIDVLTRATAESPVLRVDLQGLRRGSAKRAFHIAAKIHGGKVRFQDGDNGSLLVKFVAPRKNR